MTPIYGMTAPICPTDDAQLHTLVNATRFSRGRPAAPDAHDLSSMSVHAALERQNMNVAPTLALVEGDRATAVLERTHRTDPSRLVPVKLQGGLAPLALGATRSTVEHNKRRGAGRWWLAGCLFLASLFIGGGMLAPTAPVASPHRRPDSSVGTASRGIEAICVGQRVVGKDSDPTGSARTAPSAVDSKTWRKLVLRAEDRWPDGTLDVINVETLQPPAWLADQGGAVPGSMVSLPLDLLEMGLPEDMQAEVIGNEPCPPIGAGSGRVVLTTVNHLNPSVVELGVVDGGGRSEKVRPTSLHKFYSESREEWISAGELEIGEELCGVDGPLTVTDVNRVPGVHRVYNMTRQLRLSNSAWLTGVVVRVQQFVGLFGARPAEE